MSSSAVDIVKAYFGTLSLMSADKAALFLSDDFEVVGFGEQPIGKDAWVRLMNALKQAMPDFKIKLADVRADGNLVSLSQSGAGTHSGPMDLSVLNLPVFPPTGKTVTIPGSQWTLTIGEGKITRGEMMVSSSPDAGLADVLKAFA